MQVDEARRILGVSPSDDIEVIRAAYRRLLRRTHPDVSAVPDATARTIRLTQAYTVLVQVDRVESPGSTPDRPGRHDSTPAPPPPVPAQPISPPVAAHLADADTIAVGAPPDEVLMLLIDTAHELGEISYLDPAAGLIEVIVEFVEAPTSSVLLSLQGRATGVTDVFCTVEPLSGGDAPPSDAVARLVLQTLVDLSVGPPDPQQMRP